MDLSVFDDKYYNDQTGRSAYDPKILLCEEQKLLGGTFFALDGCKIPSNASIN